MDKNEDGQKIIETFKQTMNFPKKTILKILMNDKIMDNRGLTERHIENISKFQIFNLI